MKIDVKHHEGLLEKVPWNVEEEDEEEEEEEDVRKKTVKEAKERPRKKSARSESESGAKKGAVDLARRQSSGSANLRGKLRDLTGISLTGRRVSASSAAADTAEGEPSQARRPYSWRKAVTRASNRVRRASMRMLKKRKGLTGGRCGRMRRIYARSSARQSSLTDPQRKFSILKKAQLAIESRSEHIA